jgi:putative DNA primase/helicase
MDSFAQHLSSAQAPNPLPGNLRPADIDTFARLRISTELITSARIERVTNHLARDKFGLKGYGDLSGIVFPYFDPITGRRTTARVRRDHPEVENGRPRNKYVSAYGDHKHLYFPPGAAALLADTAVPLVLVEAEKSSLALVAFSQRSEKRLLPIGLGGCSGWRGRIGVVQDERGQRVPEVGPVHDLACASHGREVIILFDANAKTNVKVQHARRALAYQLRKQGADVRIAQLPLLGGVNGPDDYISVQGDEAMAQVLDSATTVADPVPPKFSEEALALRFALTYSSQLRFTAKFSKWHRWEGRRWMTDETLQVVDLVRDICRTAASECTPKATALRRRIASAQTVAAVERLSRADRRHAAISEQWDRDPMKLNTPGGIVDLKTGRLMTHDRHEYCTKITAVTPEAGQPKEFLKFLDRIMARDYERVSFLQRLFGYCLTGLTIEQILAFLYGTGANGKSVLIYTIGGILHDYAGTAPMETFIVSSGERHPTELAGLQGARFVSAIETEYGRRWAESKIKALTGGDRIAARYMRQDFFEFTPQFKLIVAGNHKPGLRSVDEAIRRRIHLIPFNVTIPEGERDKDLSHKLKAEWPRILQWGIEGCLTWQRQGLSPPKVVCDATNEYLAAEDALGRWLEDRCLLGADYSSSSSVLFADWREWADLSGEYIGSQKAFSQRLEERGFQRHRTGVRRSFLGLKLLNAEPEAVVVDL